MACSLVLEYQLGYRPNAPALFARLLALPRPALLHSADRSNRFGRYDIMTADPVCCLRWHAGEFQCSGNTWPSNNPWADLQRLQQQFVAQQCPTDSAPELVPFTGGFIGYFGYGLHQVLELQAPPPPDPTNLADLDGGLYDWSVVTDHKLGRTTLYARSRTRQQQILQLLQVLPPSADRQHWSADAGRQHLQAFAASTNEPQYQTQFKTIQQLLHAGDCYQVNLAQHFVADYPGHPWALYLNWCDQQAAPFSAYLQLAPVNRQPRAVVSLSPERFLQIQPHKRSATVCPIKGTGPRHADPDEDQQAARRLRHSSKDQAENLMIVDLLRNDLGRVCEPGSIEVAALFEVIGFSNVHHLVSTISGRYQSHLTALDVFAALFPSGSITGAPKIRAIDIINELEPVARSVYCGSIGYWDASGNFDSSVAIRTGVVADGRVHLWGGGGIVTDSQAPAELAEIQAKIGRLLKPKPVR